MEKRDSVSLTSSSFKNLQINSEKPNNKSPISSYSSSLGVCADSVVRSCEKSKCPSLVSLCLGVIGQHFEEIFECVGEVLASFPPDTKLALVAIAKRRKLLNDDVLISLADSSWDVLDISGSDVSDLGLTKVSEIVNTLRTVDIRRCCKITVAGVSKLVHHCLFQVPCNALPNVTLDDHIVKDIDPKAWEVGGVSSKVIARSSLNVNKTPIAEKFRLAFVERDAKKALEEAKKARKNEKLAEREWARSTEAKAVALEWQLKGLVFPKNKRKSKSFD
ncbi:hypothetical protein MKW94_030726 [Papaver nudicaule]|uniref:RNI-like superfamily protein n=1 Tax=Papaver nudicaule TaxID=74823 RepID=A0AA41S844_PAPNU|nr:hypothetical protein [Papaver nudicaule]